MKKLLLSTAIAVASITNAQTQNSPFIQEKPYIEVVGIAEKEVTPDEIYLNITLRERYDGKTKISIEEQEEKLKASLKAVGIDLKDLKVSDANANYYKVKWNKKDVISQKEYTLLLHNATNLGKVFQEFDKIDIKDANIKKVSHSRIDSLYKEVRISAIKAAKDKADYLLAAIAEKTGKALIVREDNQLAGALSGRVYGVNSRSNKSSYNSDDSLDTSEIDYEKIQIKFAVYVKFEIK